MANQSIRILAAENDREALRPILEALKQQGIPVKEGGTGPTLAVLSQSFFADSALTGTLLARLGAGAEQVLPLHLDGSELPEAVKNALYASNILSAADRDPALLAQRIAAALPERKRRTPLLLTIGALVLAALAAVFIVRALGSGGSPVPEEEKITIPAGLGLTEEDLAEVRCVVIVGEHFQYYTDQTRQYRDFGSDWPDMLFQLASCDHEQDFQWYWNEDGSKVALTPYDLRFLGLMPNLEELHMAMVDLTDAPDLQGLDKLQVVWALDSQMEDLNWLGGTGIKKAQLRCDVDYSPLASCEKLSYAILDVFSEKGADFSAFSPPKLYEFDLVCHNVDTLDLSGLAACEKLEQLRLGSSPIRDLDFLQGKDMLNQVHLDRMEKLRDISALRGRDRLRELRIAGCRQLQDYTPIADCPAMEDLTLDTGENRLRDASFLRDLPRLRDINLFGVELQNLDFLQEIGQRQKNLQFEFCGHADDYASLAAVGTYRRLSLDLDNSAEFSQLLPFLEGVSVQDLVLRRCGDVDLSALPRVTSRLELDSCSLMDLSSLPETWSATHILLNKCSSLTSLEGLQNQKALGGAGGILEIFQCPRLTDWSALAGRNLSSLSICGGYTLPDFSTFQTGSLTLDSVEEVEDLHALDGMDNERPHSFKLVGLEPVNDLSPLGRFHGSFLAVSPQLAEQGEDLVKTGNFSELRIEYPQGGWEMDDSEIALLSLDELNTLPKALLRRVTKLYVVGNQVVDPERYDMGDAWINDRSWPLLHDRQTDEETLVKEAGSLTDLSALSELTGLRELCLVNQPLMSLDGIQNMASLESLRVNYAPLTDASPVFALQDLRFLDLACCPIPSIQGVQNLRRLGGMNLTETQVTDLSPLKACDFSGTTEEQNGFSLIIGRVPIQDFSPLAAIPVLSMLDLNDVPAEDFLPYLEGTEVRRLSICNVFTDPDEAKNDALFAAFVQNHPQLEELDIPWNQELTDLSPVFDLPELRTLRVSSDMRAAINSLGQDLPFTLEIEG